MTAVERLFSEADRRCVDEAVRAAESGTSGEVVVVIIEASEGYAEVSWRSAFALASLVILADLGYRHYATFWLSWNADAVWLAVLVAGSLGFLAAYWPPLRRVLAGRERMARAVRQAAESAFARERVFETRDRTGILIFLSLLERQVIVLPDAGIAAKAPEAAWAGVVHEVVLGMKAGRPAEALVAAVKTCGSILLAAGFAARPDDTNEIPDGARFR
jgi:putative membrane protein